MTDFRSYSAAFHYQNGDVMHFGILGMKWGVRRYQNSDGTLTPAGKRRYNELNAKADYYKQKADNKYHEIFVEGKDTIPRAISADMADAKSKNLRKKASKYGTMTPEEKAAVERMKAKQESEQSKKAKEAKEYFKENATDLFTEQDADKDPKRAKAAADLGLEALNKMGRDGYDPKVGITDDDRDWFIWEDQTIGLATVADMALQGKSKEQINKLIKMSYDLDYDDVYSENLHGAFQLSNSGLGYSDSARNGYLDAIFAILNAKGYLKHSAFKKSKKSSK